jgi:hypothetical protein
MRPRSLLLGILPPPRNKENIAVHLVELDAAEYRNAKA